jgi:hypothetical protein
MEMTPSIVLSIHPSVRIQKILSQEADVLDYEFVIFSKYVQKICVLLQYDKISCFFI